MIYVWMNYIHVAIVADLFILCAMSNIGSNMLSCRFIY